MTLPRFLASHLFRVFGGHLAVAQDAGNFQPPIHILPMRQVGIQCIDSKMAFLFFQTVATETRTFQNGLDLSLESTQIRLRRSGFGGAGFRFL